MDDYASPNAVLRAITDAAKRQAKEHGGNVNNIIQLEYRNRLLARVFSPGAEWVLKGGTSTLVRLPDARATKDIDLLRRDIPIDEAIDDLKELASRDLGDFFHFTLKEAKPTLEDGVQNGRDGAVVVFEVSCGPKRLNRVRVDLVVSPTQLMGDVELGETQLSKLLPKLPHAAPRLYPLVDQISDKACAMVEIRSNGAASTRTKDLVDIVTFASTYPFDKDVLRLAITAEAALRGLEIDDFARRIPTDIWAGQYAAEAAKIPHCRRHPIIDDAVDLVSVFIDEAVADTGGPLTWDPADLAWK